jgi:hypothetical protein
MGGGDEAKQRNDIAKLKNEVCVLETELMMKDKKINDLMMNVNLLILILLQCVGSPSEVIEEKEMRIYELENTIEKMERENYILKNEGNGKKRTKDVSWPIFIL